jgi:hypothetical protein
MTDITKVRNDLAEDINHELMESKRRRLRHGLMNNSMVVASILTSAAVTIVGIFNMGITAAILGVLLTVLLALQQVFPFADMSYFYRCGIADLENLQTSLKYSVLSQTEIDKTKSKLMIIRKCLAKDIPRGTSVMEAIMAMREEVKGIQ